MNLPRSARLTVLASGAALGGLLSIGCAADVASDSRVESQSDAVRICADGPTVAGIDVSKWQGDIDWGAVKGSGRQFAFVRVSDGTRYPDEYIAQNWADTKSSGVIRGAYQFFRPGQDPIAQARLFVNKLAFDPIGEGDLSPVLDVEASDGVSNSVLRSRMQDWLDYVSDATGRTPIIYTANFMSSKIGTGFAADYPLWVANYTTRCPLVPAGWTEWDFWQHSSKGRVAGVSGNVDVDVFNGTLAELRAYATSTFSDFRPNLAQRLLTELDASNEAPLAPNAEGESGGAVMGDGIRAFEAGNPNGAP